MKHLTLLTILFAQTTLFGQHSEDLIPYEATSVLSINNVNLLQKISLDELAQYRFMEELHHDMLDGSTSGWTLKDSGVDFDQKVNIYIGKGVEYDVSGITFGVVDKEQLFTIFDDFEPMESSVSGIEMYASYFNRLAIKGNTAILYRVAPDYIRITEVTDSIWYARGNGYHWDGSEWDHEIWEEGDPEDPEYWEETPALETGLNYYELMDSVEATFHERFLARFTEELFIKGRNLIGENPDFASKVKNSSSEGIYYVDNSANLTRGYDFRFMKNYYPHVFANFDELYKGNVLSGNFYIDENTIKLDLTASYGDDLGAIYEKLGSSKFNKDILPYIHENDIAFATSNLDLENAYDLTFETALKLTEDSERPQMIALAMTLDLLNEFADKDAIFDAYKGGMFMTYGGIKKVKTKKIVFDYDEDTFEYFEREEEAEEDMPIFSWGFTTGKQDVAERVIQYMSRFMASLPYSNEQLINRGDYWEITNGMLQSVSMYIINKNGMVIFTNDEELAKNHSNGYGSHAISKKVMKKARKGGSLYGYADMNRAISELPHEIFSEHDNEMLDIFRGKTGNVELTSTKSKRNESQYELTYTFESEEDSGTYILDLINSLYVISK